MSSSNSSQKPWLFTMGLLVGAYLPQCTTTATRSYMRSRLRASPEVLKRRSSRGNTTRVPWKMSWTHVGSALCSGSASAAPPLFLRRPFCFSCFLSSCRMSATVFSRRPPAALHLIQFTGKQNKNPASPGRSGAAGGDGEETREGALPPTTSRREMNFLGGMTPTFFFCVAMEWKRSARQVSRFSFFFCCALDDRTFSRKGRQK
ncbi:hypothetical protein EYF80_046904 [Liparis tanakae]|uniref:Secreted protein n=1 Tax=Liparis tanakae TaxID=230148 RepID=A0A4Z2FPC8_9TELE|nr:hypothetical protein EYF80_046904 [Liparis tanakae]